MQKTTQLDEWGRKEKTAYKDEAGVLLRENQYLYSSKGSNIPKGGIQTVYRQDGTKASSEEMAYDAQLKTFRPVKKIHFDEKERKEKTEHFDGKGQLEYTNKYTYGNKSSDEPTGCVQELITEGKRLVKTVLIYNKETQDFKTAKKTFYDSGERPSFMVEYDKAGYKTKEKTYTYEQDGSVLVHREQFDKGKLVTKGDFMSVGGCLIPYDMEKKRLITPPQKKDMTGLFHQSLRTTTNR